MHFRSLLLFALFSGTSAMAEVTLPAILTDHMVIQRDLPVHVWGTADPGEVVTVSFRGETRSDTAGEFGRWSIYLAPGSAGGPFELTVSGTGHSAVNNAAPDKRQAPIVLKDVLVGDIWLAGGQSNMEFKLEQASTAASDLPNAGDDHLRLLTIRKRASDYPLDNVEVKGWLASTPASAKSFSAVAWYFAHEIEQREHVPVGVIDATWGGTVADSWTRLAALGQDASLAPLFALRGQMTEGEADIQLRLKEEQRQRDEAKAAGKPEPQFPIWHTPLETWGPGYLYNGMIAPLTPLPIRGVIWYQGESNSFTNRVQFYGRTFRTMIEDWRRVWGEGQFPFLYVQIANYKGDGIQDWASIREQQRQTLELHNTAMTVTIDLGERDNVHPTNKKDVGLRLSRTARAIGYGEAIEYSGPLFRQATPEGNEIQAWFDHARGLHAKGGIVSGFEVAGTDGRFTPAVARIVGSSVIASSPAVAKPVIVRYAWANNPEFSLYNQEELPASPFSSER
jgi:sialate O-acetylesterase